MKVPTLPARFPKGLPALGVASLVAGATEGYGQIVYNPVNAAAVSGGYIYLDLGGGADEGWVYFSYSAGESTITMERSEGGGINMVFATVEGADTPPLKFSGGAVIDSSLTALYSYAPIRDYDTAWVSASPGTSTRGFVAFSSNINGDANTYYGWLDLEITTDAITGQQIASDGVYVYGYAYESTGPSINAGAIPEPGTSAAIVGGAAALLALRRRRKSEVAA